MKALLTVLVLCLSSAALQSAAPHPTVVTTAFKDQLLPVIRVVGTDPVVAVGNTEKRIRTKCVYIPQRAEDFGPGYVEIVSKTVSTANAWALRADYEAPGMIFLEAEFKSTSTLRGGFILISATAIGSGLRDVTLINSVFTVHDLPDLAAGRATKIKIQHALVNAEAKMDHFIQIFDAAGREVPTSEVEKAWKYYALLEKVQLRDALPRYLAQYAGQNRDAFPVVRPKPYLRPGMAGIPAGASATLMVSPEGYVTDVAIENIADTVTQNTVREALQGWLFFPGLAAGQPVARKVQIPIQP